MSETSKTTAKKTSATKSTANTGAKTVGADTTTKPTQAQQDALIEEEKAKQEAEAKAKAEADEQAKQVSSDSKTEDAAKTPEGNGNETLQTKTPTDGAGDGDIAGIDSLGILGAFKVRAKSDQGFWRSGVQFLRKKETIVLVVDEEPKDQPAVVAQEGIESELILFMSKEKAERVHREPNLVVEDVDVSDVIEVE
ncbi:hypothetical protein WOB69_00885 [Vibrio parahaemolyticus]